MAVTNLEDEADERGKEVCSNDKVKHREMSDFYSATRCVARSL